jgi:integral membrane sensor domain MASE1
LGSTLQAEIGRALIDSFADGPYPFDKPLGTIRFIAFVPFICLVAATIGVTTVTLIGLADWEVFQFNWATWWLGDAVGMWVVTPLVLAWAYVRKTRWTLVSVVEIVSILLLTALLSLMTFGFWSFGDTTTPRWIVIPALLLASYRFGLFGATTGLFFVSAIGVWAASLGGRATANADLSSGLSSLQAFIAVIATAFIMMGANIDKRKLAEEKNIRLIEELGRALEEIKTLRGLIPICAWCHKVRTDDGAWQRVEAYISEHTDADFTHGICPECAALAESRAQSS